MSAPARSWLPAYLVLALIWGGSFYFIKLGLLALSPAGVAFSRLALGLATMLMITWVTRTAFPPRWSWGPLFVAALLMTAVPWLLFAYGEQHVSSALAGIINGATPLMTLVAILLAFPEERPTRQRVFGLAVGFLGVLVVMGVWQGLGAGTWLGIAACTLAIGCYGVSFPFVRRHLASGEPSRPIAPIALATGLMAMGTLQVAPMVAVSGFAHEPIGVPTVLAMLALGCLGSGIAYVLNFRVIARADAMTASTVTYLTPLVAVIAGAVLLGEHLAWNQPLGGVLIVAGAAITQGLARPRPAGIRGLPADG
ncbi:MAG: DMT family transporter [Actinomycetota bacterium]|nr:DMT family transporter [Actinomycetota bacterium]